MQEKYHLKYANVFPENYKMLMEDIRHQNNWEAMLYS